MQTNKKNTEERINLKEKLCKKRVKYFTKGFATLKMDEQNKKQKKRAVTIFPIKLT